jgi:hypothetical protein
MYSETQSWGAEAPIWHRDNRGEVGVVLLPLSRHDPRSPPGRILASRIIHIDRKTLGPFYFPLKRGEYIQGLLASIEHRKRASMS